MPLITILLALGSLLPASWAALGQIAAGTPPSSELVSSWTPDVAFDPGTTVEHTLTLRQRWVAPHTDTPLWSEAGQWAEDLGGVRLWVPLEVIGEAKNGRLPVHDPSGGRRGWVRAADVGPVDPALAGSAYVPPIGKPIAWSGPALITMYTCIELGGCGPTASGIWPESGLVAVDPAVIPLGSTVWIQGLGTFLAADSGSLVRGAHLEVFGWSYQDAVAWGIQERSVVVFAPS